MALVTVNEILRRAKNGGYAVGAFNIFDYLSMRSAVMAAADLKSPMILQVLPPVVEQFGTGNIAHWARSLAREYPYIPIVLHLDHGKDMNMIIRCIEDGWTSVMIDASDQPFEDNIRITKEVVQKAHSAGLTVEGEVGCILTVDVNKSEREAGDKLATVEGCTRYIEETGVDTVAPAIGTAHGLYKDTPSLDCERLHSITTAFHIPIVIHGGTGLTTQDFHSLIRCGAAKINIATQLRLEYLDSMRTFLQDYPESDEPLTFFSMAGEKVKEKVKEFITIFGSDNKV